MEHVVALQTDRALWDRISCACLETARRRFGFASGVDLLEQGLHRLDLPTDRGARSVFRHVRPRRWV